MVHAVEQWDDDAIAQFLRRDGVKCRFERRRLDRDPDDIELPLEAISDPHRRLEAPERLALNAQPLGIVVSASGSNE